MLFDNEGEFINIESKSDRKISSLGDDEHEGGQHTILKHDQVHSTIFVFSGIIIWGEYVKSALHAASLICKKKSARAAKKRRKR
jgi:hypothetical protein